MTPTPTPNRQCPDYSSHYENAADLLFPSRTGPLNEEEDAAVLAVAEAEYQGCEGHC